MMKAKGQDRPHLEIQIHPSDIQKGVRYLFLSRRQIASWVLGAALYVAFVGFAIAVAPTVIANLLSYREYKTLSATRTKMGERLDGMTTRLAQLAGESEQLRLKIGKIYLAYGLSNDTSIGQGGYPFEPRLVPNSIYSGKIERAAGLEVGLREQLQVLDTFLGEIQVFEDAHEDQVRSTPSISPLSGENFVLTSPFGNRRSPFTKAIDFHAGIDLAAPIGTPVYSTADGRVVFAGRYPLRQNVSWWRYGKLISVRNSDRFITLFGHLDEIKVRAGRKVKQGDIIGTVGNSGWSTNPHLHYEVRRLEGDGERHPVDPRIYILDHRWGGEEQLLIRGRRAPLAKDFEPLPRLISRR